MVISQVTLDHDIYEVLQDTSMHKWVFKSQTEENKWPSFQLSKKESRKRTWAWSEVKKNMSMKRSDYIHPQYCPLMSHIARVIPGILTWTAQPRGCFEIPHSAASVVDRVHVQTTAKGTQVSNTVSHNVHSKFIQNMLSYKFTNVCVCACVWVVFYLKVRCFTLLLKV